MTIKKSQKFIGCGLPISNSQYGYFNPTVYSSNQIKSNLTNLLLTKRGQKLMNPQFGTNIYGLLFQNMTAQVGQQIITEVEDTIKK